MPRGARDGVGVTEIANFAKYTITGPGAEAFLSRVMANRMPKAGRLVLSPMLNEKGKLIGDFTIAKAGEDRFFMWGSSQAQNLSHALVRAAAAGRRLGRDPAARHGPGRPLDRRARRRATCSPS